VLIGTIIIIHNVPAEQQIKASLKEIDDFKAAVDEHAIAGITDPQRKTIYVNDKFCAISKHSREELPGQDHRSLIRAITQNISSAVWWNHNAII
jgi:hypothetical protein